VFELLAAAYLIFHYNYICTLESFTNIIVSL